MERVVSKKRTYVQYEPQPTADEVLTLCRLYCCQKADDGEYRRRVSWLQCVPPGGKSVAVVEYLGKPGSGKPHGSSAQPTSNYVRTPAATMQPLQRVDERVHDKGSCKAVYDELVEDMDVEDAP